MSHLDCEITLSVMDLDVIASDVCAAIYLEGACDFVFNKSQ